MREVIISNEVKDGLVELKQKLLGLQGIEKGQKTFDSIMNAIDNLEIFEIGRSIKSEYNIDCPDNWFILYTHMNYFVFSRTETMVTILKMYNEREDIIYDLFGIEMRSQESKEYWGE